MLQEKVKRVEESIHADGGHIKHLLLIKIIVNFWTKNINLNA